MPGILILIIIVFIGIGPIFSIKAINILFNMGIELNFWTWLSMAWLHMVFSPKKYNKD